MTTILAFLGGLILGGFMGIITTAVFATKGEDEPYDDSEEDY